MEVRRKRPPPRFSVEAASSRKVGLGGDGTSSTVGRYAARGFSVLARSSWFLLSFVLRAFHPKKQQLLPLPQETRFLEFSILGDIKKTLVPSAAIRRPVLS